MELDFHKLNVIIDCHSKSNVEITTSSEKNVPVLIGLRLLVNGPDLLFSLHAFFIKLIFFIIHIKPGIIKTFIKQYPTHNYIFF